MFHVKRSRIAPTYPQLLLRRVFYLHTSDVRYLTTNIRYLLVTPDLFTLRAERTDWCLTPADFRHVHAAAPRLYAGAQICQILITHNEYLLLVTKQLTDLAKLIEERLKAIRAEINTSVRGFYNPVGGNIAINDPGSYPMMVVAISDFVQVVVRTGPLIALDESAYNPQVLLTEANLKVTINHNGYLLIDSKKNTRHNRNTHNLFSPGNAGKRNNAACCGISVLTLTWRSRAPANTPHTINNETGTSGKGKSRCGKGVPPR